MGLASDDVPIPSVRVQLYGKIPTQVPFTAVVSTPHFDGADDGADDGVVGFDGARAVHADSNTSSKLI